LIEHILNVDKTILGFEVGQENNTIKNIF